MQAPAFPRPDSQECAEHCLSDESSFPYPAAHYCQAACVYRCYGDAEPAATESARACKLGTCGC